MHVFSLDYSKSLCKDLYNLSPLLLAQGSLSSFKTLQTISEVGRRPVAHVKWKKPCQHPLQVLLIETCPSEDVSIALSYDVK